jgi:two-component system phosphate regulon sensor histidine kinase PhoR
MPMLTHTLESRFKKIAMLSFRKKILISYFGVFLIFIALMFPFATNTVQRIVVNAMQDRATELIQNIQTAKDNDDLINKIKQQRFLIFFRVSIITNERKVLYDSHVTRVLGPKFNQEYIAYHPEVEQAFKQGYGYSEDYSQLLGGQKFVYLAQTFDFHCKPYAIRTAFPYRYVKELSEDFQIGFFALSTVVLLLFTLMTWFIINHLSKPIQQIITDISPYQEGEVPNLPEIRLTVSPTDDFGKLANTLNSLSAKIKHHIDTITQERNEKEAILESLIEGVVAIDPAMVITYSNNMAQKFLGLGKQELIDNNFNIVQQPQFSSLLTSCQQEGRPLTETVELYREGRKIILDIIAAPIKEYTGAILVMQDKTEHYKMMEMRKDFIANASHELKTPITVIHGFAETLHDNPELSKDILIEVTAKIVRNCVRMTRLIKDLLALADIENLPASRLLECDLIEMIEECRRSVIEAYPSAQISVDNRAHRELHLLADPSLMQMALTNLLSNAAKYSTPPAQITVTVVEENKLVTISIADKGIGIPEADLEHIFERFYTVDKAHSQKMGGTGLGLAIVKSVVEKHYGKITVASSLGKGSIFTIKLPNRT